VLVDIESCPIGHAPLRFAGRRAWVTAPRFGSGRRQPGAHPPAAAQVRRL